MIKIIYKGCGEKAPVLCRHFFEQDDLCRHFYTLLSGRLMASGLFALETTPVTAIPWSSCGTFRFLDSICATIKRRRV